MSPTTKNALGAFIVACLLELPLLSLFFMKHPNPDVGFARVLMWYHIVPLYALGLFSYGLIHSGRAGGIIFFSGVIAAQIVLVTVIVSSILGALER